MARITPDKASAPNSPTLWLAARDLAKVKTKISLDARGSRKRAAINKAIDGLIEQDKKLLRDEICPPEGLVLASGHLLTLMEFNEVVRFYEREKMAQYRARRDAKRKQRQLLIAKQEDTDEEDAPPCLPGSQTPPPRDLKQDGDVEENPGPGHQFCVNCGHGVANNEDECICCRNAASRHTFDPEFQYTDQGQQFKKCPCGEVTEDYRSFCWNCNNLCVAQTPITMCPCGQFPSSNNGERATAIFCEDCIESGETGLGHLLEVPFIPNEVSKKCRVTQCGHPIIPGETQPGVKNVYCECHYSRAHRVAELVDECPFCGANAHHNEPCTECQSYCRWRTAMLHDWWVRHLTLEETRIINGWKREHTQDGDVEGNPGPKRTGKRGTRQPHRRGAPCPRHAREQERAAGILPEPPQGLAPQRPLTTAESALPEIPVYNHRTTRVEGQGTIDTFDLGIPPEMFGRGLTFCMTLPKCPCCDNERTPRVDVPLDSLRTGMPDVKYQEMVCSVCDAHIGLNARMGHRDVSRVCCVNWFLHKTNCGPSAGLKARTLAALNSRGIDPPAEGGWQRDHSADGDVEENPGPGSYEDLERERADLAALGVYVSRRRWFASAAEFHTLNFLEQAWHYHNNHLDDTLEGETIAQMPEPRTQYAEHAFAQVVAENQIQPEQLVEQPEGVFSGLSQSLREGEWSSDDEVMAPFVIEADSRGRCGKVCFGMTGMLFVTAVLVFMFLPMTKAQGWNPPGMDPNWHPQYGYQATAYYSPHHLTQDLLLLCCALCALAFAYMIFRGAVLIDACTSVAQQVGRQADSYMWWHKVLGIGQIGATLVCSAPAWLGLGIPFLFRPKPMTIVPESFKAARDINRVSYIGVALLALLTIFLAPIISCEKAFKKFDYPIRILQRFEQCSWLPVWVVKWFQGTATRDDIPTSREELRALLERGEVPKCLQEDVLANRRRMADVLEEVLRSKRDDVAGNPSGPADVEVRTYREVAMEAVAAGGQDMSVPQAKIPENQREFTKSLYAAIEQTQALAQEHPEKVFVEKPNPYKQEGSRVPWFEVGDKHCTPTCDDKCFMACAAQAAHANWECHCWCHINIESIRYRECFDGPKCEVRPTKAGLGHPDAATMAAFRKMLTHNMDEEIESRFVRLLAWEAAASPEKDPLDRLAYYQQQAQILKAVARYVVGHQDTAAEIHGWLAAQATETKSQLLAAKQAQAIRTVENTIVAEEIHPKRGFEWLAEEMKRKGWVAYEDQFGEVKYRRATIRVQAQDVRGNPADLVRDAKEIAYDYTNQNKRDERKYPCKDKHKDKSIVCTKCDLLADLKVIEGGPGAGVRDQAERAEGFVDAVSNPKSWLETTIWRYFNNTKEDDMLQYIQAAAMPWECECGETIVGHAPECSLRDKMEFISTYGAMCRSYCCKKIQRNHTDECAVARSKALYANRVNYGAALGFTQNQVDALIQKSAQDPYTTVDSWSRWITEKTGLNMQDQFRWMKDHKKELLIGTGAAVTAVVAGLVFMMLPEGEDAPAQVGKEEKSAETMYQEAKIKIVRKKAKRPKPTAVNYVPSDPKDKFPAKDQGVDEDEEIVRRVLGMDDASDRAGYWAEGIPVEDIPLALEEEDFLPEGLISDVLFKRKCWVVRDHAHGCSEDAKQVCAVHRAGDEHCTAKCGFPDDGKHLYVRPCDKCKQWALFPPYTELPVMTQEGKGKEKIPETIQEFNAEAETRHPWLKQNIPPQVVAAKQRAKYQSKRQFPNRAALIKHQLEMQKTKVIPKERVHAFAKGVAAQVSADVYKPESMLGKLKLDYFKHSRRVGKIWQTVGGKRMMTSNATVVGSWVVQPFHSYVLDAEKREFQNYAVTKDLGNKYIDLADDLIAVPHYGSIPSPGRMGVRKPVTGDQVLIVSYAAEESTEPDIGVGLAAADGTYNAPTKAGDCGAPVYSAQDGALLGFHIGGGQLVNRFIPLTDEMIEVLRGDHSDVVLKSADFQ